MAVVGGYEYRNWRTDAQARGYMAAIEYDNVDVHSWVFNEGDIRRHTVLGIPFTSVTESVVEYSSSDDMSRRIRSIVDCLQQQHIHLLDPVKVAAAVQKDLNDLLDKAFDVGEMIVRPQFLVEPVTDDGSNLVRVKSTGEVLIPHEILG